MIKIWDAQTGDNTFTLVGHTGEVVSDESIVCLLYEIRRDISFTQLCTLFWPSSKTDILQWGKFALTPFLGVGWN